MKSMASFGGILAVALTLGALSWAQQAGKYPEKRPGWQEVFQEADANKDGKVTFEELKAIRPKLTPEWFKQLDTNGDGVLDKNDHPPGGQGQRGGTALQALLNQADANKDGKVTFDEAKAVRPKMTTERFKQLDRDGDGVLTKADVPKEGAAPAQSLSKPAGKDSDKLMEADLNNDGKVTFDELKALRPNLSQEEFSKLDRNGDGVLTRADRTTQP